jgi:hypothetical protein
MIPVDDRLPAVALRPAPTPKRRCAALHHQRQARQFTNLDSQAWQNKARKNRRKSVLADVELDALRRMHAVAIQRL